MTLQTDDLRIHSMQPLLAPENLLRELRPHRAGPRQPYCGRAPACSASSMATTIGW